MREVVDFPDAQLAALDAWRVGRGMSRAEAIKQAVSRLLERFTSDGQLQAEYVSLDNAHQQLQVQLDQILALLRGMSQSETPTDTAALAHLKQGLGRAAHEAAFGLWKARPLDGLAEQERLRAEWDDR
jgi:hypothetical protein